MEVWILKREYGAPYPKRELKEFNSLGELNLFYDHFHDFVLYDDAQTITGSFTHPGHFSEVNVAHTFLFYVTCKKIGVKMEVKTPSKEWAWAIFHDAYPMISPDDVEIY